MEGTSIFLVTLLRFFFRKVSCKSKFSELFLPLKEALVSAFNKKRAPTSRKYGAQEDIVISNLSRSLQFFRSHSSDFASENKPENLSFQGFLPLKKSLLAAFSEGRATTSRKYVAERGIIMPNLLQTFQFFRSHTFVFALKKYPKNLYFRSIFASLKELLVATFSETCPLTSG